VKRTAAVVAIVTMLGALGSVQAQDRGERRGRNRQPILFASPGKIVAAEVALGQLARRKGQWQAFRETAAEGALMFVPQPVDARQWLKSQPQPATPMSWQPQDVFLSCDGSLAVASGPLQKAGGAQGTFTTVWQRQKKGEYKWMMSQADDAPPPPGASDMIRSSVATCSRTPAVSAAAIPAAFPAGTRGGWSADRSLSWTVTVAPDCSRTLAVSLLRGTAMEPVLEKRVSQSAGASTGCAAS
jgi:hypothetical protein